MQPNGPAPAQTSALDRVVPQSPYARRHRNHANGKSAAGGAPSSLTANRVRLSTYLRGLRPSCDLISAERARNGPMTQLRESTSKERPAVVAPPRRGLTLPRLWVIVAVFLPVVAALESSLSSIDLAYQIRAGDLMLASHHLLRTDPMTFTALGRPWLDQQWGAQVLLAAIYRAGGWAGLSLLRSALVGLLFL